MTVWNKLIIVLINSLLVDCLATNSYNNCNGCISDLSCFIFSYNKMNYLNNIIDKITYENMRIVTRVSAVYGCGILKCTLLVKKCSIY